MIGPFEDVSASLIDKDRWGKRLNDDRRRRQIGVAAVDEEKIDRRIALRVDVDANQRVQLRPDNLADADLDRRPERRPPPLVFVRLLNRLELFAERGCGRVEEPAMLGQLARGRSERVPRFRERRLLRFGELLLLNARFVRLAVRRAGDEQSEDCDEEKDDVRREAAERCCLGERLAAEPWCEPGTAERDHENRASRDQPEDGRPDKRPHQHQRLGGAARMFQAPGL